MFHPALARRRHGSGLLTALYCASIVRFRWQWRAFTVQISAHGALYLRSSTMD
ncbi:hypothetical protein ALSL_0026 [Aerosticca soli]|uniref:Uncharacterized protein n=1 Tax=Aerosticca soli TaxID=2010829 RepID=A0A2Z6E156_9GAMM|nr:hypothetical protein ALSL_0026 [Aerosticca soli]